jgi:predicted secreted Zn-dependent protease
MAFRLKPGRSVASEIRRIVLRQIEAATVGLKAIGDPESDEAVHDARRRVKKIRAVIRLVRPAQATRYATGASWRAAVRPSRQSRTG